MCSGVAARILGICPVEGNSVGILGICPVEGNSVGSGGRKAYNLNDYKLTIYMLTRL